MKVSPIHCCWGLYEYGHYLCNLPLLRAWAMHGAATSSLCATYADCLTPTFLWLCPGDAGFLEARVRTAQKAERNAMFDHMNPKRTCLASPAGLSCWHLFEGKYWHAKAPCPFRSSHSHTVCHSTRGSGNDATGGILGMDLRPKDRRGRQATCTTAPKSAASNTGRPNVQVWYLQAI